jgi:hypothetical protein
VILSFRALKADAGLSEIAEDNGKKSNANGKISK